MAATPFNTKAPMQQLVTILDAIPAIQQIYTGAPESVGPRLAAYVAAASQTIADKATNVLQREQRYFIGLTYAVEGSEGTAEEALADALDALITAVYNDRTLAGAVYDARLDFALADQPTYQVAAGLEVRVYPVMVICTQRQNFA